MSRAEIFAKIETANAALKTKAAYPDYDLSLVTRCRSWRAKTFGKSFRGILNT